MIQIHRLTSEHSDFKSLVTLLDADLNARNGIVQAQYDVFNKIDHINTVVVTYLNEIPVGCGCYKPFDHETVEIKRMFVKPENRGLGISKMILAELEKWAKESGYKKAILETGSKQHEAIQLYHKVGYKKTDNYGQYAGNSFNICMRKNLNG